MHRSFGSTGYFIVFIAGLLTGMVLATRVAEYTSQGRAPAASQVEAATRPAAPPVRQTRVDLTGNGPGESDEFDLAQGSVMLSVEYSGQDWFWFGLSEVTSSTTPNAASLGFVGSKFGPWKTRTTVRVPKAGRYRLEIRTEGDWKAAVTQ